MNQLNDSDKYLSEVFQTKNEGIPSEGLTSRIMEQIKYMPKPIKYRPVISKNAWFAILFFWVSLLSYGLFFSGSNTQSPWFDIFSGVSLHLPEFKSVDIFPSVYIPEAVQTLVVLLPVLLLVYFLVERLTASGKRVHR